MAGGEEAFDELARRLVTEAADEVRRIVRDRLLEAAMREIDAQASVHEPSSPVPAARSAVGRGEIDDTISRLGSLGDERADAVFPSDLPGDGLYAYGVCSGATAPPAVAGIGDETVDLVSVGDHAILVSPVSPGAFGAELERGANDPAWLGEQALAHERVLAGAMRSGPVLPLRFGTIYRDEDQLRRSLGPHASLFRDALRRVEGCAEWDVKVLCDAAVLRTWLEETGRRPVDLGAVDGEENGSAYLKRLQAGRAAAEEADRTLEEVGRVVFDALAGHAAAAASGPAGESAAGAVVRADTFLVRTERTEAFRRAADQTEALLADRGIRIEVAGPLPPYRFVSIDLRAAADA